MYCAFHHVGYGEEDYPDLKCPVCSLTAKLAEVREWRDDDGELIANLAYEIVDLRDELAKARGRVKEYRAACRQKQEIIDSHASVEEHYQDRVASLEDEVAASKERIQQLYASHKRKDAEIADARR